MASLTLKVLMKSGSKTLRFRANMTVRATRADAQCARTLRFVRQAARADCRAHGERSLACVCALARRPQIAEAARLIQQSAGEGGPEFGLFQVRGAASVSAFCDIDARARPARVAQPGTSKVKARWLRMERTLEFYELKNDVRACERADVRGRALVFSCARVR